jgi:hypothetical protein
LRQGPLYSLLFQLLQGHNAVLRRIQRRASRDCGGESGGIAAREVQDAGRQVREMQQRPGIERHHALQTIHELANIARPVVPHQGLRRVVGEREAAARLREKALDQKWNVFLAIAQRRQGQTHNVEPVKKVFAETSRCDFLLQVAVRRGHDANVDLDALQRTQRAQFLFLQHAEQLHLQLQRQLPNLVEESRAAVGQLDQSPLGFDCAGKRASDMAKQFALHHRAHERATVDRHELPARRCVEQRTRGDFFARTAFPLNQNRRTAGTQLFNLSAQLHDAR